MEDKKRKITDVQLINKDGQIYISYNVNSIKGNLYKEEPMYDKCGNINVHAKNILEVARRFENSLSDSKQIVSKDRNSNNKKNSSANSLTLYQSIRKYKQNNLVTCKKQHDLVAIHNNRDSKQMNKINSDFDYTTLSDVFVAKAYITTDVCCRDNLDDSNEFFLVKPIWQKRFVLGKKEIVGYEEFITHQPISKKVSLINWWDPDFGTDYITRYVNIDANYKKGMGIIQFEEANKGNLLAWQIYNELPAVRVLNAEEISNYLSLTPEEINDKIQKLKQKGRHHYYKAYRQYVLNNK